MSGSVFPEANSELRQARVIDRLPQTAPDDDFNRALVSNVHPLDWVNPAPTGRYNLVVIGAGTAGLVTAVAAAGLGAKVALVERDLMGGDCLNVGCVPSKALLGAARVAREARLSGRFGVEGAADATSDFTAVMQRMRRLRAQISPHDSAARFRDLGVDVYLGQARFTSPNVVVVDDRQLRFKKAVVATGARASAPPIPGLNQVSFLTNETLFALTQLPRRLGIVGAGPIGCEMAQAFANFGAKVLLVEAAHGVLPREERDAAEIVERSLEADGVRLLCCGKDLTVFEKGGEIRIRVESHGASYDESVDQLLIAVGRAPNVDDLGLEAAGVEFDAKSGVRVDDRLRTTNPDIYAAGDVCSALKFTHAADFMARIVVQNSLFHGRASVKRLVVPWCTYTSPEIAHVGLYPHEAQERGIAIRSFDQPLSGVDRAILDGEEEGFVRIHVKAGSDKIVGATVVAPRAGDMISHITLAMTHNVGLKKFASVIHPYPTQTEAVRKIGDQFNRTRLTPRVKFLLAKWLRWTR